MTLPAEPPTLRLRDRAGRVNRFILSRIDGAPIETWTTHGIMVGGVGFGKCPPTRAAVLYRHKSATPYIIVAPESPATVPELLAMLEDRCAHFGIVAEHLRGEEAWPK